MEILGDNDCTRENKQFAYTAELGKLLNVGSVRNEAYCGATNEFIFRKTIENLLEMEALGYNPKDTFVVIGWTSICRSELSGLDWTLNAAKDKLKLFNINLSDKREMQNHMSGNNEFHHFGTYFVAPNRHVEFENKDFVDDVIDFLVEYVWRDDLEYEKWFVQQEALKNFLHHRGYDFLMFNATGKFDLDKFNVWTKNLMKNFDYKNYIDPMNFSMFDWVNEFYPNHLMEASHPNKNAHQKFAEFLAQHVIDNNIITHQQYL
jgi:hypothetical protein